jgi:excisionase family DNA binding protein
MQPSFDAAVSALIDQKVDAAVAAAIANLPPKREPPALVDWQDLSAQLACSKSTITRLRQAGMPHVMVGDSPRFNVAAVLKWLESNQRPRRKYGGA